MPDTKTAVLVAREFDSEVAH
ncbi:hypothetical protein [Escherichia coli]|nr:hypothetical protein [Escherichia coli]